MQIKYHRRFLKNYRNRKRIAPDQNLVNRFKQRLELRLKDPANAMIKDHQLIGKLKQYRSFSVTGDMRAVYQIEDDTLKLYDIGSHNQVY